MRLIRVSFGVAAGVFAAVTVAAQDPKTTRDGVYTADQAARGKTFFEAQCAKCHHVDATPGLPKKEGPPLAGDTFFNTWEDKSVFDLSSNIRLGMPPDGSITVEPGQAADVIAYILQVNKLPAGQADLPADTTARAIRIARPAATAAVR